jgi:hypothetical protein
MKNLGQNSPRFNQNHSYIVIALLIIIDKLKISYKILIIYYNFINLMNKEHGSYTYYGCMWLLFINSS